MKTITDKQAQANLLQLLEETALSHEPIQINGGTASAVLVSEEDWRSIEETLYLLSVPGMRESVQEGMGTPIGQCSTELPYLPKDYRWAELFRQRVERSDDPLGP